MSVEGTQGNGSMYGAVDCLRNMSQAMEELLAHLPANFVWPTIVNVSPFSVYVEWGRRESTTDNERESVWLIASPSGLVMNADFRPDWPGCGAAKFDAKTAAGWLLELTKNWEWSAEDNGSRTSSSLRRTSMHAERQGQNR